jgi:hypothetical protein
VFIITPWPRFVRNPCCSELEHTTNFQEPDFLKTILAYQNKLKYQLRKQASPATVLDGMKLICGNSYSFKKASHTMETGWGQRIPSTLSGMCMPKLHSTCWRNLPQPADQPMLNSPRNLPGALPSLTMDQVAVAKQTDSEELLMEGSPQLQQDEF